MEEVARVAFVSPHAVLGGAEAVMRTLMLRLGAEWVAGAVLLQDGPFAERLRADGFRVGVAPVGRRVGLVSDAPGVRRALRQIGGDVVHANGLKAALVCGLLRPVLGTPVLWMKHDTTGDPWLSRAVALGSDDVVGVSDTVLAPLRRRRRPHGRVYNGLPPRRPDRASARRLALAALGPAAAGEDTEIIGLVGRLAVGKGQQEAIAALPAILRRRPAARLLIVGPPDPAFPGHEAALREQIAALGLEHHVTLAGHRTDAPELLAGCDVVVAPSLRDPGGWQEGFGLVVAEAMQAGTPVVAYASGSLPEVLADAGRVVDAGDRDALAATTTELLSDPAERCRLGARGIELVASRYAIDASVDAMRTRYLALAAGPRPTRTAHRPQSGPATP